MKNFLDHLQEAAKKTKELEAERLRKEAIKAYKDALKTPNLSKQKKDDFKRKLMQFESMDYTSNTYRSADFKMIIRALKRIPLEIKKDLEHDAYLHRGEKKDEKITENPYTICDILSDPSPKRFTDLILNGTPDVLNPPKWMLHLEKIKTAFEDWFEIRGGRKVEMIRQFEIMVSCKNRAPWAAWSGKVYRGVERSPIVVKKYKFTGEVKIVNGEEWLVAKGSYKSRYGAQSWTDDWETASSFSLLGAISLIYPISVVYEVDLKKNESLLSPDVIKKISRYGEEREVIRVSNAVTPVTIYVRTKNLFRGIPSHKDSVDDARAYLHKRVVDLIGTAGADAFTKTKAFHNLLKLTTMSSK